MEMARGGGLINITTNKRYSGFSSNIGLNYANVLSGVGGSNSYNADAKIGDKIGDSLHLSIGARYINTTGYRADDKQNGANASLSLIYDITSSQSLTFDANYFYGLNDTTPAINFSNQSASIINAKDIKDEAKNHRSSAGNGDIRTNQNRFDLTLSYKNHFSESNAITLSAFYHYNKTLYDYYLQNISMINTIVPVSQDGSYLFDQKIGYRLHFKNTHGKDKGELLLGYEGIYNNGDRLNNVSYTVSAMSMQHLLKTTLESTKFSHSLFGFEKFDFNKYVSLAGGARYEYAKYGGNRAYFSQMTTNNVTRQTDQSTEIDKSTHNYALEITPSMKIGEDSMIYAKYERGFVSPSPNMLHSRSSAGYADVDLKTETYGTAELGFRALAGIVYVSGALFHTLTDNEIYTYGSPHGLEGASSYGFANYDKTQRMGVELFSQQDFLGGSIRLQESVSYVNAKVLSGISNAGVDLKNQKIPYVSDYKITFGAFFDIGRYFTLYTQNMFNGTSFDLAGSKISPYSITDIGVNVKMGDFRINVGIKNVFDTLYFSYYNTQQDNYIPKSYIVGQGRTAFIEARYAF